MDGFDMKLNRCNSSAYPVLGVPNVLVLSRELGQEIVINPVECPKDEQGLIRVQVVGVAGNRVRLGVDADRRIGVDRSEVYDRKQRRTGPWPGDRAA